MTPSTHSAAALIPHLKRCGYADAQIANPFRFDTTDVDVVAFAGKPWDNWSACLAVLDLEGDSKESAAKVSSLGTTSVFVCSKQGIDWWGLGAHGPTTSHPIKWTDVGGFFREHKAELAPRVIYDAKLRRPTAKPAQLSFFDVGLMPAVEKERGETLLRLVRSEIENFHDELADRIMTKQDWEHAYRAVFWLLTAKVLNNKRVPNFINVDLLDVSDVFTRIGKHHGVTDSLPPFGSKGLRAMENVAERLVQRGSLADVSSESIAYLYEHALIDMAANEDKTDPKAKSLSVRKRRGIHGTPSVLRDHMLSQLWPLIEDIRPADRTVLEPACGHAPFLTGIVRWLREWDGSGEPVTTHAFLRNRLVGLDDYAFARELAKLNLTIADAEHKNSWTIKDGDMFAPGVLRRCAENARILLSNPPFESFAKVGAKRYPNTKEPVKAETQGVEMLNRTLKHLPDGSVFGVVMPVGVLHDKESRPIRKELLRDFDLSEISVFADNLFEHGEHEVAVLMGRKKKPRSKPPALMYRRVREAGMAAFKERLAFSWEREVSRDRFKQDDDADLRLPELDEVWEYLSSAHTLSRLATVAKGLDFKGKTLPKGCWTIQPASAKDGELGFANVNSDLNIFELPKLVKLNLSDEAVRGYDSGRPTERPQVLLNYARIARAPWKLKATLDHDGRALTSAFSAVRPFSSATSALYIWALLNSPVANAYAYCRMDGRHVRVGMMRKMPVPERSPSHECSIEQAAARYRELAIARAAAKPDATDLFNQSTPSVVPAPTDDDVRAALLAMDAAVLRAYDLPPRLERQLLDLFAGVERKGVGLDGPDGRSTFRGYYPPGFTSALPLHMLISERFDRAAADKTAERFRPGESAYVREVLGAASVGTGEM